MAVSGSLEWLQTLADTTRVRLLHLLALEELTVSELCTTLQMPQSTVSRHLKLLAADGWVVNRKDRTNHLYSIQTENWCESRAGLWEWVQAQADSPTKSQDRIRLQQVLAQRSRSQAFFTSTAEQWDRLRVELFGKQIDAFALAPMMSSDLVVAELGCGSAPLCQLLAPYVSKAYAVDSSDAMLATAAQRLGSSQAVGQSMPHESVELIHAELTDTSLPDASVDIAWLVLVLPYINEPNGTLAEARRILKRDGKLILLDLLPHERVTYRQELGHMRLGVEKETLEEWLSTAELRLKSYEMLPPDPDVRGPGLFAAVACNAA